MNLKNPFIMAPVKLGYSDDDGNINEKHISFYRQRSTYLGAVTLEPMFMDKGLREIPTQIGIDNDSKIPGLQKLIRIIHKTDTKVIAHLNHPGRMANPKIGGNYFLSSTDKACENGGAVPKRMNAADMEKVIALFVGAALRAEKAGFDILELQMGHGYLLAQYLSRAVNDRQDEFGGSFENRSRFPFIVFDAIKKAVHLPIVVRVSAKEMTPTGIMLDETILLSKILEQKGASAIHASAGTVCSTPPWFFQHMFVPKGRTWEFAAQIKKELNIPVIFVGRINSIQDVTRLKNDFKAEYIALGRALVADPDFVGKYQKKIDGQVRPCLACSEGCLGGVRSGQGLGCVVNPLVGQNIPGLTRAILRKRFAVVGAGLAGMEAAITLKKRGHEVDLYEKDTLGGQFNLAWLPPQKENLKEIIDYYTHELTYNNVSLIRKEADVDELLINKYNAILIATGAIPDIPPIKGLKKFFWTEFLRDENLPENKKILVIGGGLIGIEVTSKLLDKDNNVVVVEMLDEVARGMEMIEKTLTLRKLALKKVPLFTETQVVEINQDKVLLSGKHQQTLHNIDHIIVATGMESYHPLYERLKDRVPVYLVGDARKVGKAQEAIRDGFTLAGKL